MHALQEGYKRRFYQFGGGKTDILKSLYFNQHTERILRQSKTPIGR
jgi:hypothetical protein